MITFSVSPRFEPVWPQCACGELAYRIVGTFELGVRRETPLCARHFIEACVDNPFLSYVEGGSRLGFHNRKRLGGQSKCSGTFAIAHSEIQSASPK
jgi:hypothetical protein